MNSKWTQKDIPDLSGKVILITGANSGLGFECARTLAEKGANVVMTARSMEKGTRARDEIRRDFPGATVDLLQLDVGDLSNVRAFAATFRERYDRLDILLNNAGVMAIPRRLTADGFETQLGVNHLGHFALTGLLLEVILKTPGARIHNVSSSANYGARINFDDLMGEKSYSRWGAYGQSKLANVFFTYELQQRLAAAGHDTIANTSHPGLVHGNLQTNSVAQSGSRLEALLYPLIRPILAQDIKMGVLPMLYAMTAPEARGGVFYGPSRFNLRGYPKEQKANSAADNAADRARFWEVSANLTGVTYDFSITSAAAA